MRDLVAQMSDVMRSGNNSKATIEDVVNVVKGMGANGSGVGESNQQQGKHEPRNMAGRLQN